MTNYRYIAHIVIEAETPLKTGSAAMNFLQDSPVQKDWNGLPMILGTSIAGVMRKSLNDSPLFGFLGDDQKKIEGEGSKVIISNALLVDEHNRVCETLLLDKSPFLKIFDSLPIREHTAIDHKGVTKNGAKFDEEIVYKGTRFKFSIEFIEDDATTFQSLVQVLSDSAFRLGGGSTKGFGKFRIHEIKSRRASLEEYTSSLNDPLQNCEVDIPHRTESSTYSTYTLRLKPDDFFMFGSGFGDSDADMTPVLEQTIDYHRAKLGATQILIPASSLKGAIAHRTTYHYNKLQGNTIEAQNGTETLTEIFGEAKNSKLNVTGSKGKILISDCFKPFDEAKHAKTFDHVSIDRFTGGAIDGALFQEKTISSSGDEDWYEIEILLQKSVDGIGLKAFENTLEDIATGMLPLGGATTKGHGIFIGSWSKR